MIIDTYINNKFPGIILVSDNPNKNVVLLNAKYDKDFSIDFSTYEGLFGISQKGKKISGRTFYFFYNIYYLIVKY